MCSEYFYGRHRLHIFESIVHSKILTLLITFFHFFLWDTKGGYITWVAFMKSWRSHLQILYKLFMGDFQSFLQGSVQPVFCTWVKTLHADLACVQVGNVHWPTESCLIWNWCLCELCFIYCYTIDNRKWMFCPLHFANETRLCLYGLFIFLSFCSSTAGIPFMNKSSL